MLTLQTGKSSHFSHAMTFILYIIITSYVFNPPLFCSSSARRFVCSNMSKQVHVSLTTRVSVAREGIDVRTAPKDMYRCLIVSLVFSHLGFLEWESFAVCVFS